MNHKTDQPHVVYYVKVFCGRASPPKVRLAWVRSKAISIAIMQPPRPLRRASTLCSFFPQPDSFHGLCLTLPDETVRYCWVEQESSMRLTCHCLTFSPN